MAVFGPFWTGCLLSAAFLKHPRTPTSAPGIDYQSADSEHLMKRMRVGQPDEVLDELKTDLCLTSFFFCNLHNQTSYDSLKLWQVSFSGASHPANMYTQEDLPKQVSRTLNQGSNVMSLDFHPVQQTILLGTRCKHVPWLLNCYFGNCPLYLQFPDLNSWNKCWWHCGVGSWFTGKDSSQDFQSLGYWFLYLAFAGDYFSYCVWALCSWKQLGALNGSFLSTICCSAGFADERCCSICQ